MPGDEANQPPAQPLQRDDGEDSELAAIQAVLGALKPLDAEARQRVVSYVFRRLAISVGTDAALPIRLLFPAPPTSQQPGVAAPVDIRTLKEQKKPRSAVEMAVLVAYYLAEAAPPSERKAEITSADVSTYFKQAGFPLSKRAIKTLFDARNSGYLDGGSERGAYKLNPVGYNLATHVLPVGKKGKAT